MERLHSARREFREFERNEVENSKQRLKQAVQVFFSLSPFVGPFIFIENLPNDAAAFMAIGYGLCIFRYTT